MSDRGVLQAVLWDLDGVIADTAEYHYQAWRHALGRRGINLRRADFMPLFGQRHDTIIRFFLGDSISPGEMDAINTEKQAQFRRCIQGNVRPMPGAVELIRKLRENGIGLAVASSAVAENIRLILQHLGIEGYFGAIVAGTEVAESKPSPQIFLLAARRLGVPPQGCVVIEDAIAGVKAARAAGMKCVAVTSSHPKEVLNGADIIVETLEKVSLEDLRRLFRDNRKNLG
ncbi:MAG: HAD family phosphatase [Dehalococcoidales bacterium]|nr:HAD family phosphatase [Dehalococcoidales bacterium]